MDSVEIDICAVLTYHVTSETAPHLFRRGNLRLYTVELQ